MKRPHTPDRFSVVNARSMPAAPVPPWEWRASEKGRKG